MTARRADKRRNRIMKPQAAKRRCYDAVNRPALGGGLHVQAIDLNKVVEACFANGRIRKRICDDYGIEDSGTPQDLAARLVQSFDQTPPEGHSWEDPLENRCVFRAAVLAIASNSRKWATFLQHERRLRVILSDYDPASVSKKLHSDQSMEREIKKCLPGQTDGNDSKAILRWAELLGDGPPYYNSLVELRRKIAALPQVQDNEAVPLVAGVLGMDLKRINKRWPLPSGLEKWKAPGMRFTLACEFLRNLRWGTFKPDRHIQRLLGRWFPEGAAGMEERANQLAREVIGSRSQELIRLLQFPLLGLQVSPPDRHINEVDNLVWLLGAYVEEKGKESQTNYVTTR